MDISFEINQPYLFHSDKKTAFEKVKKFISDKLGISIHSNPNYFEGDYDNFTVADAHSLREMHLGRPVGSDSEIRFFVISFNTAGNDAQNALLKIVEEPNPESRFIFITPSANAILSTLKSRLQIISIGEGEDDYSGICSIEKYFRMTMAEKFSFSKDVAKKVSDGEVSRTAVGRFVKNIYDDLKEKSSRISTLGDVGRSLSYSNDRSASIKLILDNLAVAID